MNLIPALPLKVSKLIVDAPFDGNVSGYTTKVWSVSAGASLIYIATGGASSYPIHRQVYQLPPKETMSGTVNVWFGAGCHQDSVIYLYFLGVNMNVIQRPQITRTETVYTIPAGCNSIYIDGDVMRVTTGADVYMRPMVLT